MHYNSLVVFMHVPIQYVRAAYSHKWDLKVYRGLDLVLCPSLLIEYSRAYDLWNEVLELGAQNSTDHHLKARPIPLV